MPSRKPLIAVALTVILLVGGVGQVTAHDWQTTVTTGEMELGLSTTPEEPLAGMSTEFSARIKDTGSYEGEANRTSWGGVTNQAVEVHIKGPNGIHDHIATHIPEDGAHFHFAYTFPEAGTYTITVVTTIQGEEHAFQFQKEVGLLPAEATGEEVERIDENVSALRSEVDQLQSQVDTLQQQNRELKAELEELNESQAEAGTHEETSSGSDLGSGLAVAAGGIVAAGAFVAGRRL